MSVMSFKPIIIFEYLSYNINYKSSITIWFDIKYVKKILL